MPDITPNHPAVEAADRAAIRWMEDRELETDLDGTAYMLSAALERYTADDLRDTPAGRALMAEALEDEACRMDVVISNGDAAEQSAPAPGETGRGGAMTARDALYENPAQYLRERADAYRTETPDE